MYSEWGPNQARTRSWRPCQASMKASLDSRVSPAPAGVSTAWGLMVARRPESTATAAASAGYRKMSMKLVVPLAIISAWHSSDPARWWRGS